MHLVHRYGIHLLAVVIFFLAAFFYLQPQFQGKAIRQSDIVQYKGMSKEVIDYKRATGENSLWTNSMFGGMPTYQIRTANPGNQLTKVETVGRLGIPLPAGQFLTAMIGFYILMLILGANPWLSIVGALAFAFTPLHSVWYEAGHVTKFKAITYFPLIAAGLILAFRGRYIWGGLLFALGMGLNLTSNHIQMTYYLSMTILIYGVARLIYDYKKGQLPQFAKAVGAIAIASVLAIGSTATNLWVSYEYQEDTMRGAPILEANAGEIDESNSSQTEGLAWDYAMGYSNGWIDLFASFVPGVSGGSSQFVVDRDWETYNIMRSNAESQGRRVGPEVESPLYWGKSGYIISPAYFGALIWLFFFMGLLLVKGPIKWWLALGTLLTMLLSLGPNLEFFNRFFFDVFPLYNKFRAHNSALSITGFLVPVLAILAARNVLTGRNTRDEIVRSIYVGAGIMGGLCLFFALLGPTFFTFLTPREADYPAAIQEAFIADRQTLMRNDALRTFLFLGLGCAALYAYMKKLINPLVLVALIGVITVADLWSINRRFFTNDDFIAKRQVDNPYEPTAADQQILADPDPNFRVLDLTAGDPFQSARASYFHKSIGGYHAAKLQRFEDVKIRHLQQNNERVINMFNIKYFITQGPQGQPVAQQNPGAYGNAWFVDSLVMVNSANAEIDALAAVDPRRAAIIHRDFSTYVQGFQPTGTGQIELTDYKPNAITYQYNAQGEQLAVFSEVWYGPDKGWQAYIDGNPVEHIRVDYILRALRVPSGQHTVEFRFEPVAYATGSSISLVSSLLIVLGFLAWAGYRWYLDYQQTPAPEPVVESPPPARPKPKTGRKKKKK